MGFLLRCATRNGTNLHHLRVLAGIYSMRQLWADDTPKLAHVLGIPDSVLRPMFVQKGRFEGDAAHRVHGLLFARTGLLRLIQPQVCASCIHQSGYCRAVWDCRLYTVCHIHQVTMTEFCNACGEALRWYRPAVDVCRCGAYFQATSAAAVSIESAEFQIAEAIAKHFGESIEVGYQATGLPLWLDSLSLDGLCTLVRAFGVCLGAHERVCNSSLFKRRGGFWRGVCGRAWSRLHQYAITAEHSELAPFIWEGALERMCLSPIAPVDRQVASMLLHEVFGIRLGESGRGHRTMLSQLKLFEGA